ncbi:MAG TPA: metalloregulator ArsR/SmtB family transcription factor [Patescibacteria group bacterium]|nr:metalloregulator ArsR/SmtB family transcription factor [Patescibacteria group bacterium]
MTENERILKALANRRRLTLVAYLKRHRDATVGRLAALLKVSFPTASKHLALLGAAQVVEYERRSLQVYYRLAEDMPPLARSILKHV